MKNHAVQRFASAALAVAMLLSASVSVSAKPTSSKSTTVVASTTAKTTTAAKTTAATKVAQEGYTVVSTESAFQVQRAGKTIAEYEMQSADATLTVSKSGNVVLSFKAMSGKTMNVNLSSQNQLNFAGSFASLTISGSVPTDRTIVVNGTVKSLNVNGAAPVTLNASAVVSSLKVGSAAASVTVNTGAKITSAYAVKSSAITGYSGKISAMNAVTAAAPATTTLGNRQKSTVTPSTSNANKEKVFVDMEEADSTGNTEDINFLSNNTVEITAKDGVSLGLAVRDIKLTIRRDTDKDNDRVGGQWKWIDTASTTYTSGTYTYRFTPSLTDRYPTVDVKVVYTGSGTASKPLGKAGISFVGSSHGKGGDVRIEVTLPDRIQDDSTLYLKVDGKEIEYSIDEDDSGDEKTYTVTIDPSDYEDGDKVKISARIRGDGKSSSSKTINYLIEK